MPEGRSAGPPASPQRQFSHGVSKKPLSVRTHRFLLVFYWLVPSLVLLLIVSVGIYVTIKLQSSGGESGERESYVVGSQSGYLRSSSLGRTQLLTNYLEAMGGREVIEAVKSIQCEGRIRNSAGESEFRSIATLPDKGALTFRNEEGIREHFILNEPVSWRILEQVDGVRKVESLEWKETENMMRPYRLIDPLRELALGGGGSILFIRETTYKDVACYKVTKEQQDGSTAECYLERETFYTLAMVDSFYVQGRRRKREIVYSDYRMVSGVVEPFKAVFYIDGEFSDEIVFTSIRINPEIYSEVFEVPEELVQ